MAGQVAEDIIGSLFVEGEGPAAVGPDLGGAEKLRRPPQGLGAGVDHVVVDGIPVDETDGGARLHVDRVRREAHPPQFDHHLVARGPSRRSELDGPGVPAAGGLEAQEAPDPHQACDDQAQPQGVPAEPLQGSHLRLLSPHQRKPEAVGGQ